MLGDDPPYITFKYFVRDLRMKLLRLLRLMVLVADFAGAAAGAPFAGALVAMDALLLGVENSDKRWAKKMNHT